MTTEDQNRNSGRGQLVRLNKDFQVGVELSSLGNFKYSRKQCFVVKFLDAVSIENNQLNLLMFGPSGHGKSSTANSILGRDEFPVSFEGDFGTERFMSQETVLQNYRVKILDPPPAPRVNQNFNTDVIGFCTYFMPDIAEHFPEGCHTPILVLKYGFRIERTESFSLVMLQQIFGQKFIRDHCVCIITSGDMFEKMMSKTKKYNNFQDWCKSQTGILGDIFQAISYRCVLFDNESPASGTKKLQVQQLMSMIIETWPPPKPPISVCPQMRVKADIHALVETASSQENYRRQLEFLINYTSNYKFNPKQFQISLTICGASENRHFAFDEFASHKDFAKKLRSNKAPYLEASSGTDKALALVREEFFGRSAGYRAGTKQIALIITEGKTEDVGKTLEEADNLKSSGVVIMAAGVNKGGTTDNGDDYRKLMEHLASDPSKVFIADDYNSLTELSQEASQRTCEIAPEFASTADVLFIVDSSGSIGKTNYTKVLDFVVKLTECFNIGSGAVRFSLMVFSTTPQLLFDFKLNTHEAVKKVTLTAPYMNKHTHTWEALDLARTSVFDSRNKARKRKIAIVITNGRSQDSNATSDAAGKLQQTGVLIMAIGVGNANHRELERIVSRPDDISMVDDYDALQNIQDKIATLTSNYENVTCIPRQRGASPERFRLVDSAARMDSPPQRSTMQNVTCIPRQRGASPERFGLVDSAARMDSPPQRSTMRDKIGRCWGRFKSFFWKGK